MSDLTSPAKSTDPISQQPDPDNPNDQSNEPDPPPSSSSSTPSNSVPPNPNYSTPPPPPSIVSTPQPPSIHPYSAVPPSAPSFRPAAPPVPVPSAPQYSPLPNHNLLAPPNYQNAGVQAPGVSAVSSVPPIMPQYASPGQPPNPAFRMYAPMPNGYPAMPQPAYQGTIPAVS